MSGIELNEKDILLARDLEAGSKPRRNSKLRNAAHGLFLMLCGAFVCSLFYSSHSCTQQLFSKYIPSFGDVYAPAPASAPAPTTETPSIEVFEVSAPVILAEDAYVSQSLIFNQTSFIDGLSADLEAPEVFNFTGGYLTLNFTNNDTTGEFTGPVVAEISIGDSPIWRTSTPTSRLNAITQTSTTKNVTEFLSLFRENQTVDVTFLEGAAESLSVSFELTLYNDTDSSESKLSTKAAEDIFTASGPASNIVPLAKAAYPGEAFDVIIPQVTFNTTVAKISLFASASKDEAAYYKNEIAALGAAPGSNGPLRQLHVYADDVFIGSITPKPTLFHPEAISTNENITKLWNPLADFGSFSGLAYEIDLVNVLPLLWEGDVTLSVIVSSPIDVATEGPGAPYPVPHPIVSKPISAGSWFISGNFLSWESPVVQLSTGEVVETQTSQLDSGVLAKPPSSPYEPETKNQVAKSNLDSSIVSNINFTFVDNSTASYAVLLNVTSFFVSTYQSTKSKSLAGPPGSGKYVSFENSRLVLVNGQSSSLQVSDLLTDLVVLTKEHSSTYPFSITETTRSSNTDPSGPSTSSLLTVDIGSDSESRINSQQVEQLRVDETASNDNFVGFDTDIRLTASTGGQSPFKKEVEAINGVIVRDVSSSEFADNSKDPAELDLFLRLS